MGRRGSRPYPHFDHAPNQSQRKNCHDAPITPNILSFEMSTATLTPPERQPAPRTEQTQTTRPVVLPRPGWAKLLRDVLDHGGPGYLQFAITNICNAKCDFCGFAVD